MPRRPIESDPKKELEYRLAEVFRKRDMPEKLLRLKLAPIAAWAYIKGIDLGDAFYKLLPFNVEKPGPKISEELPVVPVVKEKDLTPEPVPGKIEEQLENKSGGIEKEFQFGD